VVVGIFVDGVPRPLRLVGFGVALVGVWLLAGAGRSAAVHRREITLALVAGLGFAIFFILIDRVSESDVLWPLVAARGASLVMLAPPALRHWRARQRRAPAGSGRLVIAVVLTGLLHTVGDTFFALATRTGRLDVAVVLSSLYPLATILLARALLREELNHRQQLGAGATILAILLIAA
jgi:drug/metabolite transporter (DMT)-like permease